jgi:capsular polysaccharide export protein
MRLDLAEMAAALSRSHADQPAAPTDWGDMRQHMFWGAIYHAFVFAGARAWPGFRAHRAIGLGTEARLHLLRLALQPWQLWQRARATRAILRSGHPFHLVLLQLEHDASFRSHSPFRSMAEFLGLVLEAFAQGAPPHHHLVLKAHPLEDGRAPLRAEVARLVARHGLEGRVHFVPGGRLSQLLDHARSAVTVNSTAGQQALWRGLPLRCCGAAVYARPGLVSTQPLAAFFARPQRPDCRAYRLFRRYLLETSQVVGGFYSRRGRRLLLRRVVDMMLSPDDPYDSLRRTTAEAGWCAGPDLPQGGAQHPQGPLARARQAATIPRM